MDTLDFEPTIKTRAIVVESAVDKRHDRVVMIAEIGPNESGPPAHIHLHQQETYEVLEGEAEFLLGDEKRRVKTGDIIEIRTDRPIFCCWPIFWVSEQVKDLPLTIRAGKGYQPVLRTIDQGTMLTIKNGNIHVSGLHGAASGGGCATSFASRRRFCAIAASVNSSCAPRGPRRRKRPSRRMRFK